MPFHRGNPGINQCSLLKLTLENDNRDEVTLEFEARSEIGGIEYATARDGEPINVIECALSELGVYA
jgi:hypothetical protein